MKTTIAAVLATFLLFQAAPSPAQPAGDRGPSITVRGDGRAEVPPDIARLSVEVVTRGKTLETAGSSHKERAAKASVGLDELVGNPEPPAEVECPRLSRREHVRRAFDEPAVAADGFQDAAQAGASLGEGKLSRGVELGEMMCGGEARDSTADDGDAAGAAVGRTWENRRR